MILINVMIQKIPININVITISIANKIEFLRMESNYLYFIKFKW